jgi:hypothetical protein
MAINPEEVQWDAPTPSAGGDSTTPPSPEGGAPPTAAPAIDPAAVQWQPSFAADPHAGMTHEFGGVKLRPGTGLDAALYPEVDFDQGLPFLDRTHLAQADNFTEKKLYLEKVYGKKNIEVDTDPFGEPMLVVLQGGKKIAAEGGGGFEHFGANVVGSGPEWIGAGAGGLVGLAGGPAGAVGGAALGAGIGKESTQLQKQAEGWYSQSNQEAVGNALRAVEAGAMGEVGGQLTSKLASRFIRGRLPSLISGTTPETRAMTEHLLDQGARPPLSSAGPDLKALQWKQRFAEQTVGPNKAQAEANTAFIRRRVRDLLGDSGLSDAQADAVAKELEAGETAIPTAQVGQHMKERVAAHREMLTASTQRQLTEVNETLDTTMKHLDQLVGRYRTGSLGVDTAGAINAARQDFGKAMSKGYQQVDRLAGDRKLVDTDLPGREAQRLGRRMPKTGQQPLTRETAGLGPQGQLPTPDDIALYQSLGLEPPAPDAAAVSFADAQRFRSAFRAKADELSLTRDPKAGEAARMADMWDYAIQQAGAKPEAAPAVKMLNAVDSAYSKGIKRFKDQTVQRLVNDMKAGLPPDAETVAATIVQPGQEARVREVRKLVGEDIWKRVAGADYSRMMTEATDETGQVSGQRLLRQIRERGKLMAQVYGDDQSREITEFAKAMAARDGKLDPRLLAPGKLKQTVSMYREAQAQEDRFMKTNALALLSNPKQNPEAAYRWLVRPGNGHALDAAVKLFGEGSGQVGALRQAALQEVLTQAKFAAMDATEPNALAAALKKYTPAQQKLLFPNGMDSDLHLLAKEIEHLTPTQSAGNVGIAAGVTNNLPFFARAPVNVYYGLYNTFATNPSVIRWLTTGLRSESGSTRIAARHMVESLVRYGAISPTVGSDAGAPQNGGSETIPGADGSAQALASAP